MISTSIKENHHIAHITQRITQHSPCSPLIIAYFGKHLENSLNECVRPLSISAFLWKDPNKKWNIFKTQRRLSGPAVSFTDRTQWKFIPKTRQRDMEKKQKNPTPILPVCRVERKRTIGSCLGSTQKCYCQSAQVSPGKKLSRLQQVIAKVSQKLPPIN